MFQVPTKMVIISGSGFPECLFFICCRSWQNPSLFWKCVLMYTFTHSDIKNTLYIIVHIVHLCDFLKNLHPKTFHCCCNTEVFLPLCHQRWILCAEFFPFLSLPPMLVCYASSVTSPTARLKIKHGWHVPIIYLLIGNLTHFCYTALRNTRFWLVHHRILWSNI